MAFLTQNLPSLIIKRIVDLYLGNFIVVEERPWVCIPKDYFHITTLLGICRLWREVALNKLYQDLWWCGVDSCNSCDTTGYHNRPVASKLQEGMSGNDISRVKTVRLHWKSVDILDGTADERCLTEPFSRVFPKVKSLELSFGGDTRGVDTGALDETSHAEAFCKIVSGMFPNMRSIAIPEFDYFQDHMTSPFVQSLVTGLFSRATSISEPSLHPTSFDVFLNSATAMRKLALSIERQDSSAIEVIRRSAGSLEELRVTSKLPEVFAKVVLADDGTPITYPCVRFLEVALSLRVDPDGIHRIESPVGVPFPNLKRLDCTSAYPFNNDVLFRGNSLSLKRLYIVMEPRTASELRKYGLLGAGRFPALEYVDSYITHEDSMACCEEIGSLFLLAANASIVKVLVSSACLFEPVGFSVKNLGRNITILDTPDIKFTLRQILQLIKALPYLRRIAADLEVTDELRSTDGTHEDCIGQCKHNWRQNRLAELEAEADSDADSYYSTMTYEDCYDSGGYSYVYFREFFLDHLGTIYADMEFMEELYAEYYPLSTTLTILDKAYFISGWIAHAKMIAIATALCPSLQRVQTDWVEFNWNLGLSLNGDPFRRDSFISRAEIVETKQHSELVSRLERGASVTG